MPAVLLPKLSVSLSPLEGGLCAGLGEHVMDGEGTCWPVYSLMTEASELVIRKVPAAARARPF